MKVIQITNRPRESGAGGDLAVDRTVELLRNRGHEVEYLTKSSRGLDANIRRRFGALASSLYSRQASDMVSLAVKRNRPDIVHVHNLYPLFSPSILGACHRAKVPVIVTLHSFFLTCPTMHHFRDGETCELCVGGREYWAVLKNCRGNRLESIAYAFRTVAGRWSGTFLKHVTRFVALTEFAKSRFIDSGIPAGRISVVPNLAPIPDRVEDPASGEYAAFLGRLSPEKGCDLFVGALGRIAHVKGAIAGDGYLLPSLVAAATKNVLFKGWLTGGELHEFLTRARFLVLPSRCFEMCPLALFEAMGHGKPVIVPRIGGLPEFVENGVCGLFFEPGDATDLAKKIDCLWQDDALVRRLGRAARRRVEQLYGVDAHYERLMATYEQAIDTQVI